MPLTVRLPENKGDKKRVNYTNCLPSQRAVTPVTEICSSDANYQVRVQAALQATCRHDYPAGMILWLEKGDPALYEELTSRLPDLIQRLWSAHAPYRRVPARCGQLAGNAPPGL